MTQGRKKTIACPHCGCRVSGQQGTCPQCGRKLTGTAQLKCPYCRTAVLQSDTTCSVCGRDLPKVKGRPSSKRKDEDSKAAPKRGGKSKRVDDAGPKCPKCSSSIESLGSTCPSCGYVPPSGDSAPLDKGGESQTPKAERPRCPLCGTEVSATDERCTLCGVEFEPEEGPAPEGQPPLDKPAPAEDGKEQDADTADCPVCGAAVSLTSAGCPKCGAEFEPEEPSVGPITAAPVIEPSEETAGESEEEAECPVCGSVAKVSARSCPSCGAEFEPVDAIGGGETVPSRAPPSLQGDENVTCPVCGAVVGASVEACPRCGAEFEPEVVPEEPPRAAPGAVQQPGEEEVLCPVCGRGVGPSVEACPYCGVEFEVEEGPDVQASMFAFKAPTTQKEVAKGIVRPPPSRAGDGRRGISNGASAVNGVSLVNGVGQATAPSRVNGLGATNGMDLVNGMGLSNGGAVNGRRLGPRGRHRLVVRRWQLMAIIVACAIVIPAFFFATIGKDESPFSVDGGFDDWEDEARLTTISSASSPSIDIVGWSVAMYSNTLYLYIETESPMMAGEVVEGFVLFIDSDGSAETGYSLAELGADAMIELQGWNGSMSVSLCSAFGSSDDKLDWNAWVPRCGVTSFLDGARLEASAELSAGVNGTSRVMLASIDEDGPGCRSCPVPIEGGVLVVEQTPSADIVSDGILEAGTDVIVSTLRFSCLRAGGVVNSVSPELVGIELLESVGSFSLQLGEELVADLRTDTSSAPSGQFVSVVVTADDVQSSFTQVYVLGDGTKAYVGAQPENITVDGAFADWAGLTVTDVDAEPVENPNIDIDEVGGANDTDRSYFFVSVHGEMCMGTYVPEPCSRPTASGSGTVVQARRTGEDLMRIYIDSDGSSSTGFRVNADSMTIGAERLIEVSGLCGEVKSATLSIYVDGDWTETAASIDVEIDGAGMELDLDSSEVGGSGDFDFLVITTDWMKAEDLVVCLADYSSGSRSFDRAEAMDADPGPIIESMPEFGDVVVPVVFILVTFVVLARRRRQLPAADGSTSPD